MPRILVIDDDRMICQLLESALTKRGYKVVTALNGDEGLKQPQISEPDLAIIDKMMPGMDGYEVLRRIRRDPHFSHVPVLILTSLSDLEEKLAAFEVGADDYLSKPFAVEELAARLSALLRRSEALKVARQQSHALVDKAHVIAVHSLRGGLGCTSLAINLALGLRNLWQSPALLVDLVLTAGQVALMLNKPLKRTWSDLAGYDADDLDLDVLTNVIDEYENGLHFIPAPAVPTKAELILPEAVQETLVLLRPRYDYIVADLPHDFSETTLSTLETADTILLLLSPELASIRRLPQPWKPTRTSATTPTRSSWCSTGRLNRTAFHARKSRRRSTIPFHSFSPSRPSAAYRPSTVGNPFCTLIPKIPLRQ